MRVVDMDEHLGNDYSVVPGRINPLRGYLGSTIPLYQNLLERYYTPPLINVKSYQKRQLCGSLSRVSSQ
jgi:hypothetical protein